MEVRVFTLSKVFQRLESFLFFSVASNIMLWKDSRLLYHLSTSLLLAVTYLQVCHLLSHRPAIKLKVFLAPALVGNVVVWKPSPAATYSNYILHQIFTEAGHGVQAVKSRDISF